MAGWTYTGVAKPVSLHLNPDGDQKAAAFPALAAGNLGFLQDFAYATGQDFALELRRQGIAATLLVSANNGAGDVNGIGTLTITLTTA